MVIRIVALVCLLAASAHADAKLVAARRAVEDVRYDDARALLVEALKAGTNSASELREIYRLSAATAQVLGQPELAEQYYRRLLALEPDATLPADASPRLREPFVAAQAYMVAHGRLELAAAQRGRDVVVTVVSDPLHMVAGVAAVVDGARFRQSLAGATATLAVPRTLDAVDAIDEHGNTLLAVRVERVAEATPPTVAPPIDRLSATLRDAARPGRAGAFDRPARPATPRWRRWPAYAIPSAAFAAVAAGFAIDAKRSRDRLDAIIANAGAHFFDDAEVERKRYRRDAVIADVAAGVAGALAVTAVIVYVTRPMARVAPVVDPQHAAVGIRASF